MHVVLFSLVNVEQNILLCVLICFTFVQASVLHACVDVALSGHVFPVPVVGGLSQSLVLCCCPPPQSREQTPYDPHSPHTPFVSRQGLFLYTEGSKSRMKAYEYIAHYRLSFFNNDFMHWTYSYMLCL